MKTIPTKFVETKVGMKTIDSVNRFMVKHPKTAAAIGIGVVGFGAFVAESATAKSQTVDSTASQKRLDIGGAYGKTAIKTLETLAPLNFNEADAFLKLKLDAKNEFGVNGYLLQGGKTFSKDSTNYLGGVSLNYAYTPIESSIYGLKLEGMGYWNNNARLQDLNQAANTIGGTLSVSGYRPFMTPWTQSGLKLEGGVEQRKGSKMAYEYSITPFLRFMAKDITVVGGEEILLKQTGMTYGTDGIFMPYVADAQPYFQTILNAQIHISDNVSVSGNAKFGINQQKFGAYLTTTVAGLESTLGFESMNLATQNGQTINGWRITYSAPVTW